MMLNIVNKSPFASNSLDSCLSTSAPGSSVLLIEDGVYAALSGRIAETQSDFTYYALESDLQARGLEGRVPDGVEVIDYSGFVDLVADHDRVQSWL